LVVAIAPHGGWGCHRPKESLSYLFNVQYKYI